MRGVVSRLKLAERRRDTKRLHTRGRFMKWKHRQRVLTRVYNHEQPHRLHHFWPRNISTINDISP